MVQERITKECLALDEQVALLYKKAPLLQQRGIWRSFGLFFENLRSYQLLQEESILKMAEQSAQKAAELKVNLPPRHCLSPFLLLSPMSLIYIASDRCLAVALALPAAAAAVLAVAAFQQQKEISSCNREGEGPHRETRIVTCAYLYLFVSLSCLSQLVFAATLPGVSMADKVADEIKAWVADCRATTAAQAAAATSAAKDKSKDESCTAAVASSDTRDRDRQQASDRDRDREREERRSIRSSSRDSSSSSGRNRVEVSHSSRNGIKHEKAINALSPLHSHKRHRSSSRGRARDRDRDSSTDRRSRKRSKRDDGKKRKKEHKRKSSLKLKLKVPKPKPEKKYSSDSE